MSLDDKKVVIKYPCNWNYKVIGRCEVKLTEAIKSITLNRECKITPSNVSKNGKYKSLNSDILVFSDEDRLEIFEFFKTHKDVVMVL